MQAKELAGCVIRNEHGELLVLHRNTPSMAHWELPGGKLEDGETTGAAATRECQEELGVDVELRKLIGTAEFEQAGIRYNYTWHEATIAGHKEAVVAEPNTFDTVTYMPLTKLRSMPDELSPNLVNLLNVIE